jgi:hypothetical protein
LVAFLSRWRAISALTRVFDALWRAASASTFQSGPGQAFAGKCSKQQSVTGLPLPDSPKPIITKALGAGTGASFSAMRVFGVIAVD